MPDSTQEVNEFEEIEGIESEIDGLTEITDGIDATVDTVNEDNSTEEATEEAPQGPKYLSDDELPKVPRIGRMIRSLRELIAEYKPMFEEYRRSTIGVEQARNEWMDAYETSPEIDVIDPETNEVATFIHHDTNEVTHFAGGLNEEYDQLRLIVNRKREARIAAELAELEANNAVKAYAASQVGINVDPERIAELDFELGMMYQEITNSRETLKSSLESAAIWKPEEFAGKDHIDQYAEKIASHNQATKKARARSSNDGNGRSNSSAGKPRPKFVTLAVNIPGITPDWHTVDEKVANNLHSNSFVAMNTALAKLIKASVDQDQFLTELFKDKSGNALDITKENIPSIADRRDFNVEATDKDGKKISVQVMAIMR